MVTLVRAKHAVLKLLIVIAEFRREQYDNICHVVAIIKSRRCNLLFSIKYYN